MIRLVTRSPCEKQKTGFFGEEGVGFYGGGMFGSYVETEQPIHPVFDQMVGAFNRMLFNRLIETESGDDDGSSG